MRGMIRCSAAARLLRVLRVRGAPFGMRGTRAGRRPDGPRTAVMAWRLPLFVAAGLLAASAATAGSVSYGSLMSADDGSTQIITDSLNNRQYVRWDILAPLTYGETLNELSSGGAWEGWSIAGVREAQDFVDALLGPSGNDCVRSTLSSELCGAAQGADFDALLGANYFFESNVSFFRANASAPNEVGFIAAEIDGRLVFKNNSWDSIQMSNRFSEGGANSFYQVSWLVYREIPPPPVPGPAALPLVLTGIAALGWAARRRRRAG